MASAPAPALAPPAPAGQRLDTLLTSRFLSAVNGAAQDSNSEIDCNIQTLSSEACFINNINVTDCKDVTIQCINDTAKEYAVCTPDALQNLAGQIAAQTITNPDDQAKIIAALVAAGYPVKEATAAAFQQTITDYVSIRCDPQLIATQQVTIPSLTLSGCDKDVINATNTVRQSALCAAGALSTLVAQANLVPAIPPAPKALNSTTIIIIVVIVAVALLGLFIGCGFVARAKWRKAAVVQVPASASLPATAPAAAVATRP